MRYVSALVPIGGAAAALVLAAAGCSVSDEQGSESVAGTAEPMFYLSTTLWPTRDIPVCFDTATTSGDAARRKAVRDTMVGQRSWSEAANINFVGWGFCPTQGTFYGIRVLFGADGSYVEHLGYIAGVDNNLHISSLVPGVEIGYNATHEFGHALGIAHEQNRPDAPPCDLQGENGDSAFGPYDNNSAMGYCPTEGGLGLSRLDQNGADWIYPVYYGDDPRLSDYNGDGRVDLLCHDKVEQTGTPVTKQIDYASSTGQYDATDWSGIGNWCTHYTGRVFAGDFNRDGRADLLCHDMATGKKWIDFADASGHFAGTDWYQATGWCSYDNQRLYVGDFNGDGRDDLLCHAYACVGSGSCSGLVGSTWIDYADSQGKFAGTDASATHNWCSHAAGRLMIGDFNGDGRDDLLCQDVNPKDGAKWIDYADSSGHFAGTDWTMSVGWCNHATGRILVGDFNGDGRSDLFCQDETAEWIDFADSSGHFAGNDWKKTWSWCAINGGRLHVGRVNADNRDDLVCHDVYTGDLLVDYADSSGYLGNTDWRATGRACGGDHWILH